MTRYIRNAVVLIKTETTVGTDAVPTGLANAVLIAEMDITPIEIDAIKRDNIKGYFGADSEMIGVSHVKCSVTVELAGSGAAATAPAWGPLLLAAATAEGLLTTPDRVEYTPVSTALKTATIYYYDDGVLHKMLGVMGDCTLMAKGNDRPKFKFEYTGIDGAMTATANATPTLTGWKVPVALTKANVVDITLGATYAAGALTGGTAYPSNGLELKFGNVVNFDANLTNEKVEISNREMTGSFELELTAAQEVAFMAVVKAGTLQSLAFTIGTATGYKLIIHAPAMQLKNPRKVNVNGTRYVGYDYRLVPVSGNDEVRFVLV